jgi:hypothetical protein
MIPGGGGGSGSSIGASLGKVVAKTTKQSARSVPRQSSSRRTSYSGSSGGSGRGYSSSGSGGGGSRYSGSGGGGGGGGYSGSAASAVPTLSKYLGMDSTYQSALSGTKRSLADFLSEIGRRRTEAGTQFNQTTASMERDRVQQLADLRDEFASRGLIQSGIYGKEQGDFQTKFTEQQTALQQQQAALLADLLSQQTNYKREQDLALEQAKQEALARRAAKYNVGG